MPHCTQRVFTDYPPLNLAPLSAPGPHLANCGPTIWLPLPPPPVWPSVAPSGPLPHLAHLLPFFSPMAPMPPIWPTIWPTLPHLAPCVRIYPPLWPHLAEMEIPPPAGMFVLTFISISPCVLPSMRK